MTNQSKVLELATRLKQLATTAEEKRQAETNQFLERIHLGMRDAFEHAARLADALLAAQAEPVAWMVKNAPGCEGNCAYYNNKTAVDALVAEGYEIVPLYAALSRQPAQAVSEQPADQWNAAIEAAAKVCKRVHDVIKDDWSFGNPRDAFQDAAQEIEAAIRAIARSAPTDEQPSQPEASKEGGAASELHEALGCFEAARIEGLVDVLAESSDERLKDLVTRRILYAEPAIERAIAALASQPVAQQPAQESVFLTNLHYFFAQTDGTYAWPVGSVGDLLKQAKREIEVAALSRAQSAAPAAGMTDEQIWQFAIRNGYVDCFSDYQDDEILRKEIIKFARALLSAAPAAVPEGWKLVPVKPTSGMGHAGEDALEETDSALAIYDAMLAAAPQPVAAPARACSVCYGTGFDVAGKPCPCGCRSAAHPQAAQDKENGNGK